MNFENHFGKKFAMIRWLLAGVFATGLLLFTALWDAFAIEVLPKNGSGDQSDGSSDRPSLSTTGRYVAFQINGGTNLGYLSSARDIVVFDREMETLERITESTAGGPSDGFSNSPRISGDGDKVVFQSGSTDLVTGDNNNKGDVFLYVRSTGTMTRISVDSMGTEGNNNSYGGTISENGTTIAFTSDATNLITGDAAGADVFVLKDGVLRRISETAGGAGGDGVSRNASLSRNGDKIAFVSRAANLAPNKTNGFADILVYDENLDAFEAVSAHSNGTLGNDDSESPSISFDGRYVAFYSGATNLVDGDTTGFVDIFVHDRQLNETERVSLSSTGVPANADCFGPSISFDGRYVAFQSAATNLVPGDNNGEIDFFIYDRVLGSIFRASVSDANEEANGASSLFFTFSPDGSTIAFASAATNLVPDDTNGQQDIFVAENVLLIRTDALIGLSQNLNTAKGGGVYTNNGALQRVVTKVKGRKKKRFYLFIQNDGLSGDTFTLRSNRPKKKAYTLKLIRITGGSVNITGAVKGAAGFTTTSLAPNDVWICQGQVKGKRKRGRQTLTFTTSAGSDPNVRDVSSVKVIAKP